MSDGLDPANHTQVPNDLFDDLLRELTGSELRIVLIILRKTRGWHKETDKISYSQIQQLTGLSRASVSKGISSLAERRLIAIDKAGNTHSYKINYYTGLKNKPVQKINQSSLKTEPQTGSKTEHTKETVKETIQKKSARDRIPEILKGFTPPADAHDLFLCDDFLETYKAYWQYMKSKYSSWPNEVQVQRQYLKLAELQRAGHDPVAVINQTIEAGNKSFYELKNFSSENGSKSYNQPQRKEPEFL